MYYAVAFNKLLFVLKVGPKDLNKLQRSGEGFHLKNVLHIYKKLGRIEQLVECKRHSRYV
jgi:hypothetical protein